MVTGFEEASNSCATLKQIFNLFEENWISKIKESLNVKVKKFETRMVFSDVKVITISESHCKPTILHLILTNLQTQFQEKCQICGVAVDVRTKTTH